MPPPNVDPVGCQRADPTCDPTTHGATGTWDGLSNIVWGSHVYFETSRVFAELNPTREHTNSMDRPMALTKFAGGRHVHPTGGYHPAAHRYPVHWTGDSVALSTTVGDMLDSSISSFMQYVHSDCGNHVHVGQGNATATDEGGDNIRWTALCTFSGIFRYHGDHHVPWRWGTAIEDIIRGYLNMRAKLLPSLVAGGHVATLSGWPLTARCDLHAPQCAAQAKKAKTQYVFLNDTLVVPIHNTWHNMTTRHVWIPPGEWHDAYNGSVVRGPANLSTTQPFERIPLFHRAGSLVVLADDRTATRVEAQDWTTLILEAFPAMAVDGVPTSQITRRTVVERARTLSAGERTQLVMETDAAGKHVHIQIGVAGVEAKPRAWLVRVHLRRGQKAARCLVNGAPSAMRHLMPPLLDAMNASTSVAVPFGGRGSPPGPQAGPIVEVPLDRGMRALEVKIELAGDSKW